MPGYTEYVLAEGSFSYGQAVAVITAYRNEPPRKSWRLNFLRKR